MYDWLLDSDPSIRWQVMRDLLEEPADVVARERARIATEGWGARLLDLQGDGEHWSGVTPGWASTQNALTLLGDMGIDPEDERVRQAIARVRDHYTWGPHFGNSPFFEGETEPCINGRGVLAAGAYFGEVSERVLQRLLSEQLPDGGWNCEAPPSVVSSFHTTINVLEGLLEYELAKGATPAVSEARRRGEEYLLERRLFRSRTTGDVVDPQFTELAFPNWWHYDVLRALDYFRRANVRDARLAEAIELVRGKADAEGRWARERIYGDAHFEMEGGVGQPSRWITLRALRVLRWYDAGR
ncbi:MAG: hypothetical protein JOZ54_12610 [Acidobacteria bacterium]|nr:hypothetical protein [Acidobacteriota bacterium]